MMWQKAKLCHVYLDGYTYHLPKPNFRYDVMEIFLYNMIFFIGDKSSSVVGIVRQTKKKDLHEAKRSLI
uniref:Uncharacterized protein n=1 Tax=Oryza brachyantha TaxID=4533 RepID=J3N988_ORYBR